MCHALIIEDEPFVAMLIEDLLLAEGVDTVTVVVCEEDAITEAAARRPDFITSDVTLVSGSGPDAVRAIHRAHGDIPVLFITATPERCPTGDPPVRILQKPASSARIGECYREMTGR